MYTFAVVLLNSHFCALLLKGALPFHASSSVRRMAILSMSSMQSDTATLTQVRGCCLNTYVYCLVFDSVNQCGCCLLSVACLGVTCNMHTCILWFEYL